MKKFVPVVIAVVFVLSVVYVSYFGMRSYIEDFTVKAKEIVITNCAFSNNLYTGGEIPINEVTIENEKMKSIDVIFLENIEGNENRINLAFKIEPENTTSRTVTFTTTKFGGADTAGYALKDESSENLTEADMQYDIVYKQTYNTVVMWLVKNSGGFTAKITMNDGGGKYCKLYVGVWDINEDRDFLPEFWQDKVP